MQLKAILCNLCRASHWTLPEPESQQAPTLIALAAAPKGRNHWGASSVATSSLHLKQVRAHARSTAAPLAQLDIPSSQIPYNRFVAFEKPEQNRNHGLTPWPH